MIKLIKVAAIIAVSLAIGFWLGMRTAQPDVNTLQKALLGQSGLTGTGANALGNNNLNGLNQGNNALSTEQQALLRQALINAITNAQKGASSNPNLNLGLTPNGAGSNTQQALGDRLIELGNRLKGTQQAQ